MIPIPNKTYFVREFGYGTYTPQCQKLTASRTDNKYYMYFRKRGEVVAVKKGDII